MGQWAFREEPRPFNFIQFQWLCIESLTKLRFEADFSLNIKVTQWGKPLEIASKHEIFLPGLFVMAM